MLVLQKIKEPPHQQPLNQKRMTEAQGKEKAKLKPPNGASFEIGGINEETTHKKVVTNSTIFPKVNFQIFPNKASNEPREKRESICNRLPKIFTRSLRNNAYPLRRVWVIFSHNNFVPCSMKNNHNHLANGTSLRNFRLPVFDPPNSNGFTTKSRLTNETLPLLLIDPSPQEVPQPSLKKLTHYHRNSEQRLEVVGIPLPIHHPIFFFYFSIFFQETKIKQEKKGRTKPN